MINKYYILVNRECLDGGCGDCGYKGVHVEEVPLRRALLEYGVLPSPAVGKRPTCPDCGQGLHWLQTQNQAYCGHCGHFVCVTTKERATLTVGKQTDDPPVYPFTCILCGGHLASNVARHGEYFLRCASCEAPILFPPYPGGAPALLTPRLPRQSGAQAGDQPYSDAKEEPKWDASPELRGCPDCGSYSFTTQRPISPQPAIWANGTLYWPHRHAYFKCMSCGKPIPELPIPPK